MWRSAVIRGSGRKDGGVWGGGIAHGWRRGSSRGAIWGVVVGIRGPCRGFVFSLKWEVSALISVVPRETFVPGPMGFTVQVLHPVSATGEIPRVAHTQIPWVRITRLLPSWVAENVVHRRYSVSFGRRGHGGLCVGVWSRGSWGRARLVCAGVVLRGSVGAATPTSLVAYAGTFVCVQVDEAFDLLSADIVLEKRLIVLSRVILKEEAKNAR